MNPADSFSIQVASVPNRGHLVAEVWLGRELLAELRHEDNCFRMQIYARVDSQPWDVLYEDFARALRQARERLDSILGITN